LEEKKNYLRLDYSKSFAPKPFYDDTPDEKHIKETLVKLGKIEPSDHLNCGACGYATCREHAIAIIKGLAEDEMCLPYTIETMNDTIENLNVSNEKLANAKEALKQSEKLAHMGQLSAGIAHELNNPLGVITMYCNILKDETDKNDPVYQDLNLIVEQADRCKNIVGGLLNFARKNQVRLSKVDVTEYIKHTTESIIKGENIQLEIIDKISNPEIYIDKDQMAQVFTNLYKNAIEAMPDGGKLSVILKDSKEEVEIRVKDTGTGIEEKVINKVFTPFFTTKAIGKGTGMGLPLVYGIIKMHKGKIKIESNTDEAKGETGTSFIIKLPRKPEVNKQK
jgi:signal transduction histidine kinase